MVELLDTCLLESFLDFTGVKRLDRPHIKHLPHSAFS